MTLPEQALEQELASALRLHQEGAVSQAQQSYERLLSEYPNHATLVHLLGVSLQQQGRLSEALPHQETSVRLEPGNAAFHYNLGLLYLDLGETEKALASFQQSATLQSGYPEAWEGIATASEKLGRLERLAEACEQLVKVMPATAYWHVKAAQLLERMDNIDEAQSHWLKSVHADPENLEHAWQVAKQQYDLGRLEWAVPFFRHVLTLQPDHLQATLYLSQALSGLGQAQESRAGFRVVADRTGLGGVALRSLFTLPVIYDSAQDAVQWRTRFAEDLQALAAQPPVVKNPVSEIGVTPFYLAYMPQPEVDLMPGVAALLQQSIRHPGMQKSPPRRERPKIAVVSRYLNRRHTIHRLFANLIRLLDREKFEVLECPIVSAQEPQPASPLNPRDNLCPLHVQEYWEACDALLKEAPDVILYPDIGMEPMSYYLALHRLAPVQCMLWGHPLTTGFDSMDYFISNQWMESDSAQAHYCEKLVLHPSLNTVFPKPILKTAPLTKGELGLKDSDLLYLCPQSLFKFHPDFDPLLTEILKADPRNRLGLIEGDHPAWTRQLCTRWERSMPGIRDRLVVVPKGDQTAFFKLMAAADALLDIPQYSGGNTTLDALAFGIPVVTMQTPDYPLLRQRHTSGILQYLGQTETIVHTPEQYIETALRITRDGDYRKMLQEGIFAAHETLYENPQAARELEAFLLPVVS